MDGNYRAKYNKYKLKYLQTQKMGKIQMGKTQKGGADIVLEPATQQFITGMANSNLKPFPELGPVESRGILDKLQENYSGNTTVTQSKIEDINIDYAYPYSIRVVKPQNANGKLPVVIYYHGGGWILGNKQTHDNLIRQISSKANVVVVFVNYTPSPEAHYKPIMDQSYDAVEYVVKNHEKLGVDIENLFIAGDSAGGQIAIAMNIIARDKGIKVKGQMFFYPVTDGSMGSESQSQFADGPWLTRDSMIWFWNAYVPNEDERSNYIVSPINATKEELSGLPCTLLITDENDILRDEGEQFGRNLISAGVTVTAVRYIATMHDFMMLNALAKTPATCSAIDLVVHFIMQKTKK